MTPVQLDIVAYVIPEWSSNDIGLRNFSIVTFSGETIDNQSL